MSDEKPAKALPLPEFTRPPLVETALGVEFLSIEGWSASHFHRYARHVERSYPDTQVMDSVIGSTIESFGKDANETKLAFDISMFQGQPPMRWWYTNDSDGRLIQLQRDRFVHNWRKLRPDQEYPRYERTRQMFGAAWTDFLGFLQNEKLPTPTVSQAQVDYVNHLERGVGWQTLDDFPRVTPWVARPSSAFLPTPEVEVLSLRFVIPPERGRLHVVIQPAIRNKDQVEILQLQFTARGRPGGSTLDEILTWLDLGHEWVVRGFAEMTTGELHQRWGRTS